VHDSDELVREFLIESHEGLDRLDHDLVALEGAPGDRERLGDIFRTIHTIKGTCGFLGFTTLESVTHVGENLLSHLRDGGIQLDAPIITGLLSLVDAIREVLRHIERDGTEGGGTYEALIEHLTFLQERRLVPDDEAVCRPGGAPLADVHADVPVPATAVADRTVRIDVAQIDRLFGLVEALADTRDALRPFMAACEEPSVARALARIDALTSDLHADVGRLHRQPIGHMWGRFPRFVRDLAASCGKRARLELHGWETVLDRPVVEAIKDPLTHLLRNAVDHGLETPAVRLSAGKPAEGVIRVTASYEDGEAVIAVADDGGGIDPARVREKAIASGLLTREQADRLFDHEVLRLVFVPGFSTAPRVSNVSGRGVGMDVVRTNIERIGGTVAIDSTPGLGTTLRLTVPGVAPTADYVKLGPAGSAPHQKAGLGPSAPRTKSTTHEPCQLVNWNLSPCTQSTL